eukprot:CAMPEP_0118940464 /NCGR_PEP_ID=MMETSP1169-20130426/31481_1 /TAXON_ID=36882 /ORGANISM="Pyramimonas obovata, Strain CCMP722" /LENGTH=212 /DNA_ID=CAMNT_0006884951 /DNA_START=290 /DNA_END=928 /DNA_ORIENTATION=-
MGGDPFVLGLTGSIGMGKSAVAELFRKIEVPVMDSDQVVHDLYARGGAAVGPVGEAFPGVIIDEAISRPELGKCVLNNDANMKRLESIVHPLVAIERQKFVSQMASAHKKLVVLDIPLLYETGSETVVDAVAVVSTGDADVQRQRVLARPGMTAEKYEAILARQIPDEEKRRRADYTIDTGCALQETEAMVAGLVQMLCALREEPADVAVGF